MGVLNRLEREVFILRTVTNYTKLSSTDMSLPFIDPHHIFKLSFKGRILILNFPLNKMQCTTSVIQTRKWMNPFHFFLVFSEQLSCKASIRQVMVCIREGHVNFYKLTSAEGCLSDKRHLFDRASIRWFMVYILYCSFPGLNNTWISSSHPNKLAQFSPKSYLV